MTSVYERLKNLQITLPDVPPPVVDGYVAAFVPFVRTGNLIYLSGRLAKKNGKLWCGKLGEEITTAEGKQAARSVAIELLATLQAAIGDLNDVRRIVKLLENIPLILFVKRSATTALTLRDNGKGGGQTSARSYST